MPYELQGHPKFVRHRKSERFIDLPKCSKSFNNNLRMELSGPSVEQLQYPFLAQSRRMGLRESKRSKIEECLSQNGYGNSYNTRELLYNPFSFFKRTKKTHIFDICIFDNTNTNTPFYQIYHTYQIYEHKLLWYMVNHSL